MGKEKIFISHSSKDDEIVKVLRKSLEIQGLAAWVDSRELTAGKKLTPEIEEKIEQARAFIVVISQNAFNSPWVLKETKHALGVQEKKGSENYLLIPLLLAGVEPEALNLYFAEEPVGVEVKIGPGGISEAMPHILAALGERLPADIKPMLQPRTEPLQELLLELSDPCIIKQDGKLRARATASLTYLPGEQGKRKVKSKSRFLFTAPLGPIESDNLSWYLERYFMWPTGVFKERARKVEEKLPEWGRELYEAVLSDDSVRNVLAAWQGAGVKTARRFTVFVDSQLLKGTKKKKQAEANEAATLLLGLPWELLHDEDSYLFQGAHPVQVRRRLPNRVSLQGTVSEPPIRLLLVCPRPEDDRAGYIDHRVSALPLVTALESLGELADLTLLEPPTFPALQEELGRAQEAGTPYHVVHFDGHGVFRRDIGLGGLCFEDPQDDKKLEERRSKIIDAVELAKVMRGYRTPLFFLEACQTAKTEKDPTASVAAALLDKGVASVVAMSHSVLVETARRFVEKFYLELATGARVGKAMLAGQRALNSDTFRIKIFGAGRLHLQDWFVPVLYQEEQDLQLLTHVPSRDIKEIDRQALARRFGALPPTPEHNFVGRSRELLKLERLLAQESYAVLCGQGGEGKTTLAVELGRWLIRTNRFDRAVFVCVEDVYDVRTVVDRIGQQLVLNYTVAEYGEADLLKKAFQPIERELREERTLVILDNMESILPLNENLFSAGEPHIKEGTGAKDKPTPSADAATPPRRGMLAGFKRAIAGALRTPLPRRGAPKGRGGLELKKVCFFRKLFQVISNKVSGRRRQDEDIPGAARFEPEVLEIFFELCNKLLSTGDTRLLFTSREELPPPFAGKLNRVTISRLEKLEAIELVHQAMTKAGITPKEEETAAAQPEVEALVEAVNCHARSLVLLAPYIGEFGVRRTTENLGRLMAKLHEEYPDERERSLFASVELSLRRLSPGMREKISPLGVFYGGAHAFTLQRVLELSDAERDSLIKELIGINLAEPMPYGFFRFHPALCPYLRRELNEESLAASTTRWAESMRQLSTYLYEELFKDAQVALNLTTLELPNLLRLLEYVREQGDAEETAALAARLEQLIAQLGRKRLLAQVAAVREEAAKKLPDWSSTQFRSFGMKIERLLGSGNFPAALQEAKKLLDKSLQAGESAYPGAAYDTAVANFLLGRVLKMGGASEAALQPIEQAYSRFQKLAEGGNESAAGMASASLTEKGDCLHDLGRLEEAAAAYEAGIESAEELEDDRADAVGKIQLGTVRMQQKRYDEALKAYDEALKIFENLGEPGTVAVIMHQKGMVYENSGRFEEAEKAYRQALALKVQQNNPAGEASSLTQLGVLYGKVNRLEEAVTFFLQAVEKDIEINDMAGEGKDRNNLANILIKLKRFEEARREIERALECIKPYGHAAQPWKTWMILHTLEQAEGNEEAAEKARQQAIQLYLSYRRDGGENHSGIGRLYFDFLQSMQSNKKDEMKTVLEQLSNQTGIPKSAKTLISKLQAILEGSRDEALAADPDLDFDDAAEIKFLLEKIGSRE